ncbi:hypothetical protein Amal_03999 [Acetobacter malorum]|uniref:Uncharacterized protein n=1 Tax=Acetobacter malorum TaxID=178901 RepID=A0A177FZA0_9PROT|nr:hypothetical protein Amal_03999 [Acetobacter malorum]
MANGMHIQFAIQKVIKRKPEITFGLIIVSRPPERGGIARIHTQNPVHMFCQMHGGKNANRLKRHDIIGCVIERVEWPRLRRRALYPHYPVHLPHLYIYPVAEQPGQMRIKMRLRGCPLIQTVQRARPHPYGRVKPGIRTIHGLKNKADAITAAHTGDGMREGPHNLVERKSVGAVSIILRKVSARARPRVTGNPGLNAQVPFQPIPVCQLMPRFGVKQIANMQLWHIRLIRHAGRHHQLSIRWCTSRFFGLGRLRHRLLHGPRLHPLFRHRHTPRKRLLRRCSLSVRGENRTAHQQ